MEKNIGEKIFLYRGNHNLTQEEFAKLAGLSFVSINRIENNKVKIKADTYARIMKILNQDHHELA